MISWVKILKRFSVKHIKPSWGFRFFPLAAYDKLISYKQVKWMGFFLLMVLSFVACEDINLPGTSIAPTASVNNSQIDPLFTPFYEYLGGEELLGPAISAMVMREGKYYQYAMNGLLVYDQSSPTKEFFYLYPIGREIGIVEKNIPTSDQNDLNASHSQIIGKPFVSIAIKEENLPYGLPLTEMFYNPLRRRYEQYFDGAAFYQMKDSGEIGLLAYGVLFCGNSCRKVDVGNSIFDYSYNVAPVFRDFVNQHGIRFTGFPLSELIYSDGNWVQVFQNVVLVSDSPDHPQSARLFPVAKHLGVLFEPATSPSGLDGMNFYSTVDGLGYDIPVLFWDFLVNQGGLMVSGPPVSHLQKYEESTLRQCFENLCLIYDDQSLSKSKIYLDQLGYQFLGLQGDVEIPVGPTSESQQARLILRVEESKPTVRSDEQQEIQVTVLRNGFPVSGVELELSITLPDNTTKNFVLSQTGMDGKAYHLLPIIQAENGSVILYQVCVMNQEQANFCYEDSFTIWNQP